MTMTAQSEMSSAEKARSERTTPILRAQTPCCGNSPEFPDDDPVGTVYERVCGSCKAKYRITRRQGLMTKLTYHALEWEIVKPPKLPAKIEKVNVPPPPRRRTR
jgi:hypothetical protein